MGNGVRVISYENRYLVMLLSSVINEKKAVVPRRKLNWREILKLAEFHRIVSPVYYGSLGMEKGLSNAETEQFYDKYHREILLGEEYKNALEVILWQMQRYGIPGVLLRGIELQSMYPQWELGYTSALEILVSERNLEEVHEIMLSMDYEHEANRVDEGRVYFRTPGIRVIFYNDIRVGNEVLHKYLMNTAKKYYYMPKKTGVLPWDVSLRFLYQIGRYLDAYMTGNLRIRDIMDYHYLTQSPGLETGQKQYEEILGKAGLTEFVRQLNGLTFLWFGKGQDAEPAETFQLEEYIFSKGMESQRLDSRIIPYEKIRVDFYQRDREEEWEKKQQEWMFPPREYMIQFFPILRRVPCLLCVCWGIRVIRIFKKSVAAFIREKRGMIKEWMAELKVKIINKLKKKEGIPEDEEHEDR
ncbi:nucleotidyltransferase family protein [Mediterraneibacter agrestimuris]|uniref:nucleotidyltransferase family protein n=1 Tax=Mediterraneibacter agrestimuris TaxID=2941333 RepID=UPI00204210C6|nr:nucleotidyltransferase family protein [Mediterraneibacter agrestimuris]